MSNWLSKLKEILFYGKEEGIIEGKRPYVDFYTGEYSESEMCVLISKNVKLGNRKIKRTKEILVNKQVIDNFKIGDYYYAS